ncbi:MAG: DNA-3-methyladenine glycosylase [Vulcanimicrobiaceae bacterium]
MSDRQTTHVAVVAPYRLDLTVAVLRRFSTNVVDVVASDGAYVRAHATPLGPRVVTVRQIATDALAVGIENDDDPRRALALVERTLGVERHAAHFARAAANIPWLKDVAARMRGVRPPRYASLWEACVNAIVFQQVSLHAATAILGRVIVSLETPIAEAGVLARPFPEPQTLLAAPDDALRLAGLSAAKIATLRRVATALEARALEEATLEKLPSPAASARLCEVKGIGPWTAAVILLRGLGRLDVFPENDSGVARSLRALTGTTVDVPAALAHLAPEQGMLYYHLLLARLEARGEIEP